MGIWVRFSALLSIGLLSVSPAFAFDAQKLDNTIAVFRSGTTAEGYVAHNADRVLANLGGHWFGIISFSSSEVETAYDRLCHKNYSAIGEIDPNGFTVMREMEGQGQLHTRYQLMSGNVYSFTTPFDELVNYLALGPSPDIVKRRAAFYSNGIATINRVDEDTLVIQKNYQMPEIYVRCPD
ncbi:hypothetical protein HNQ96_005340 [Aminobacter lissarensis]|uniref:Uncharacterized protein n=1 Tax=Aminobacter carboxidus TaxID=376165 RepID=A0A8E2BGJ1_9HYPH|nr:hypothetical protein [Aminobacter lissarensis]MBB6469450.1 hypothetical protein [Aminobacter lissarensis]